MPWPVYTERVLTVSAPGNFVAYEGPAGHRLVVKAIAVVNNQGSPGAVYVRVPGALIYARTFQAVGTGEFATTTVAVYGGELVEGYVTLSGQYLTVSGFEFEDPSGRAGPPGRLAEHSVEAPPAEWA